MTAAFVHIGSGKAGSSTLQKTLHKSSRLLRNRARIAFCDASHLVSFALGKLPELPRPDGCFEGMHHAILSTEALFAYVKESEHTTRLVAGLRQYFDKVIVLCYLRRQDEGYVGSYSTALLSGETRRFSQLRRREAAPLRPRMQAWDDAVPYGNLLVRRFGPGHFRRDFVSDFLEDLNVPPDAIEPHIANVSPTMEVMEVQRLLNIRFKDAPDRRTVVKWIGHCNLPGQRIGLSREERMAILAGSAEDDRWLARRFFDSDELFDHPIPDDKSPDVDVDAKQVIAITVNALAQNAFEPTLPVSKLSDIQDALDWSVGQMRLLAAKKALIREQRLREHQRMPPQIVAPENVFS